MQVVDLIRIGLSSGPPAKFPPLLIHLSQQSYPVKVKLRNYSLEQRSFLLDITSNQFDAGMIVTYTTAPRARVPLSYRKPAHQNSDSPPTFDVPTATLFLTNTHAQTGAGTYETCRLAVFANFDISKGSWQLTLDRESREWPSFITPDGLSLQKACSTALRTLSHIFNHPSLQ